MSWVRLETGMPDHVKWSTLSDAAFRLGIRAICWARSPDRERRTPGFVPEKVLIDLSRRSPRAARLLAKELVDAGQPLHDVGILEPTDGGWLVHDFAVYGPPNDRDAPPSRPESPKPRMAARSEAGRLGGLRSAEARREANGSAQPKQTETGPKQTPKQTAAGFEANPEAPLEANPKLARAPDPGSGSRSSSNLSTKDLSGSGQKQPEANRNGGGGVSTKTGGDGETKTPDPLAFDYVSECPPKVLELCTERGLVRSLAAEHHVADADVIQAIVDYRDHFLLGAGFGEKRRMWVMQVRRRILALAKGGQLKGLGTKRTEESAPPADPPMHPRAAARLAAQKAEADRVQRELAKTVADAPVRNVDALLAGIGGAD